MCLKYAVTKQENGDDIVGQFMITNHSKLRLKLDKSTYLHGFFTV